MYGEVAMAWHCGLVTEFESDIEKYFSSRLWISTTDLALFYMSRLPQMGTRGLLLQVKRKSSATIISHFITVHMTFN
jgi:hypothetical protein